MVPQKYRKKGKWLISNQVISVMRLERDVPGEPRGECAMVDREKQCLQTLSLNMLRQL
jgi:hypothetical protein